MYPVKNFSLLSYIIGNFRDNEEYLQSLEPTHSSSKKNFLTNLQHSEQHREKEGQKPTSLSCQIIT